MTLDRAALIEAMALADYWNDSPDCDRMPGDEGLRCYTAAAALVLPVAVRAILAPLRELHRSQRVSGRLPGSPGVDVEWTQCAGCSQAVTPPCPTVRLLDAIEADLIGDAK